MVVICDSSTIDSLFNYEGAIDAIIVTSLYYVDEIRENLYKKVHCRILAIGDVVYKMM